MEPSSQFNRGRKRLKDLFGGWGLGLVTWGREGLPLRKNGLGLLPFKRKALEKDLNFSFGAIIP